MQEDNLHRDPKREHALQQAYAHQRSATPSELTQTAAWQFAAKGIWPAKPEHPFEKRLIDTTVRFCLERGITNIPPVFIIDTPKPNAASVQGMEIMITTGLLKNMPPDQVDAVIGHELSHHRHNIRDDIAQLGIGYGAVYLVSHLWHMGISALGKRGHIPNTAARLLNSTILSTPAVWLGSMLSITPYRHFMELEADKEGAQLTSPANMKDALVRLEAESKSLERTLSPQPDDWKRTLLKKLLFPLSSHPSTEKRIAKLDKMEQEMESFAKRIRAEQREPAEATPQI